MTEEPRPPRRRPRGRRRGGPPRPQQAPAEPQRPSPGRVDRGGPRERPGGGRGGARERGRGPQRPERALATRDTFGRERRSRRGGRGRSPRSADDVRPGTPCVILVDAREGEPDRSGAPAIFEGFFDFETGEPRRPGNGIPRLRVGDERLWGFECWWRVDAEKGGITDTDREEIESSKRLLRGLLRDARRSSHAIR